MDEWLLGKAEWKTIQFPSSFIKLHILSHPYLIIQSDLQFWILDCASMILKSLDIPKDCQIISVDIDL